MLYTLISTLTLDGDSPFVWVPCSCRRMLLMHRHTPRYDAAGVKGLAVLWITVTTKSKYIVRYALICQGELREEKVKIGCIHQCTQSVKTLTSSGARYDVNILFI
jgi:hypothetical protein